MLTNNRLVAPLLAALLYSLPATAGGSSDVDSDGIADSADNCLFIANADQRDTDGDGLGNLCDADLNQDCIVNVTDLGLFRSVFFSADPDADFNGDGVVNVVDLGQLRQLFFAPPGPSGPISLCSTVLSIQGRVETATPAQLIATVAQASAGGASVDFAVTTSAGGDFSIDIAAPGPDYFVSLNAVGTAPVTLRSLLGEFGSLEALAVGGVVSDAQTSRTAVGSVSSALAVLLQDDQGGSITSDAQLAEARRSVPPPAWLRLAALFRTVVNDPSIALPGSSADLFASVLDPNARVTLRDDLLLNHLDARDAAIAQILAELDAPWDAPAAQHVLTVPNAFNVSTGTRISLNPDFTAGYLAPDAAFDGTWSLPSPEVIRVTPTEPLFTGESFPFVEDPANPGMFIQTLARTFLDDVALVQLIDDGDINTVMLLTTITTLYPDFPELNDTVTQAPALELTRNAYSGAFNRPLSAADVSGREIVLGVFHSDLETRGLFIGDYGYDVFALNPDGTGLSERRALAFTWSVLPEGVLRLDFANGDVTTFTAVRARGPSFEGVIEGSVVASGATRAADSTLLFVDRSNPLDFGSVMDTRWRSELATTTSVFTTQFEIFDWNLLADGTACRNPFSPTPWTWGMDGGRIEIDRTFPPNLEPNWRRSFESFNVTGDRHWGIETLETFPAGPLADPGTVAGRINIYSKQQNLAGNSAPVLVPDTRMAAVFGSTVVSERTLTANDIDAEGDQLLIQDFSPTGSLGGTLELVNVEGVRGLRYTPPAGATAGSVDAFSVQVTDRVCPFPNGATTTLTFMLQ